MERPNPRDIDTRIQTLDEPTGSIEFGPRRAANPAPKPDTMGEDQKEGEDQKPGSSSNLAGSERAAVEKAERRQRDARASGGGPLRRLWRRLSGQTV